LSFTNCLRLAAFGLFLLAASQERTAVFSLDHAAAKDGVALRNELAPLRAVTGVGFDAAKAEITLRLKDRISDRTVIARLRHGGWMAKVVPGRGLEGGPDTLVLTPDGSAVGPLDKLRVTKKYTVFDVYAEWCAPCEIMSDALHKILSQRADVAVRGLNLVSFESPLATELGLDALPHLIVFSPSGKRTEIEGADLEALNEALKLP
jgi:thiol-disulfide isomerase/thioredoxin